ALPGPGVALEQLRHGRARLDHAGAGPPDRARSASVLLRDRGDARHPRGESRARAAVLWSAVGRLLAAGVERAAEQPRGPAGAGSALERPGRPRACAGHTAAGPDD